VPEGCANTVPRPVERGGEFSGAPQFLGALPSLKNTEKGVPDGLVLSDLNYT